MLEKVRAKELGYNQRGYYYLDICPMCQKGRYVQSKSSIGKNLCKSCAEAQKSQRVFNACKQLGYPVKKIGNGYFYLNACPSCGKERWLEKKYVKSLCKSCAALKRDTRGENHYRWKGGITTGEYIEVTIEPNNPYISMARTDGRIQEHRLVMAQHLGKVLGSWEVVHHINGNKHDKRIEKLELFTSKAQHQVYTRIQIIENEVRELRLIVKYLLYLVQQGNPVLNSENESDKCVETIDQLPLKQGNEIVQP